MSIKINKLEIENVKRVKAVRIKPTENGLTVIGGNNKQGKTSILDAIAWGLGGNRFKPTNAKNTDSIVPPTLKIVMNNGLVVERKGKNSDLKVIDPSGEKAGQNLLDSFVEELAINLPKFMEMNSKDKAQTLLQIIGVGDQLVELEQKEIEIYNKRHAVGQIADQKKKFADEQDYYPDAPNEPVSAMTLIQEQQKILTRNGENNKKRQEAILIQKNLDISNDRLARLQLELSELQEKIESERKINHQLGIDIITANKTVAELQDESTAAIEKSLNDIEEINVKVRKNLDKEKAESDAQDYRENYDELSIQLQDVRNKKRDLLNDADLPLPELSIENGELIYKGHPWDGMADSEKLIVATSIVRKLKPECGFVLIDKLESMDIDTLETFGQWLESEGLQAIATRVSTGDECQIIIEDGYVKGQDFITEETITQPKFQAGKY